MPEEKKPKNDPKEQRRSRRRQDARSEKKHEKQATKAVNQPQEVPKVTAPEKPAFEPPGPEFYKSLKRETDEILKITEEENMKYKKKEIQSNWAKYEMPIDSYNEIEEQENMGADYEALIQAPLSAGGHFQFKHEKSWDVDSGPSLYDKYFEIDMDKLALALSTIPFYERNNIDKSNFNDTDIFNMNNRATKFKQKYYNDKKYTTPELEAQETILSKLSSSDDKNEDDSVMPEPNKEESTIKKPINFIQDSINNDEIKNSHDFVEDRESPVKSKAICNPKTKVKLVIENTKEADTSHSKKIERTEDINEEIGRKNVEPEQNHSEFVDEIDDIIQFADIKADSPKVKLETPSPVHHVTTRKQAEKVPKVVESPVKEQVKKNPAIESPEDLEKWLDDFLDG